MMEIGLLGEKVLISSVMLMQIHHPSNLCGAGNIILEKLFKSRVFLNAYVRLFLLV
jgi:hypothetical protein